ncbi:MAG: class I SAM-dependent methyltransferase [Candidatus Pacearchaeota archaeon]|nr:class I SAM-dependent methyltransferase [Candidatus Pacearchaeota archaeon]
MKLNLGCGNYKREGYVNCDVSEEVKPDKIIDLEKKLPFKEDTITDVYSRHTLEHIGNFIQLMEEIWRVCKNGARIEIIVPYFAHPGAFWDPTHKRFFTLRTFVNSRMSYIITSKNPSPIYL